MATERLILEVRTTGTRQVNRNLGRIRKEASQANRTLALLRSTLVVVAGARVIGGFLELSDTLTNIRNRLRLVTNSTEQLNAVQTKLFSISQETRSSFEANAVLFNRLARSTDGLGLSFNDLLALTRGFNQAAAISGTTAQEARNALIQFSQGLAAGALRGDELRSVVEQFPRLADAIAKGFNISAESTARSLGVTEEALREAQKETQSLTGGALIAFAKINDGALTTEKVIKALQADLGSLDAEFAKIDITVSQAFTKFQNELILFIGGLSESVKLGRQVDTVLTLIARNLDVIAFTLAALLALGAFNLLTSQLLRFGSALSGVVSFLTTGFTSVIRLFGLLFIPLIRGTQLAARGAVLLTTAYTAAVKVIFTQVALLGTRFGLLRLAIIASWGQAMAFMRTAAVATSRAVVVALGVIPAVLTFIVAASRRAAAGMFILTGVVGGARAAFLGLATVARGAIAALATGFVRLIPIVIATGGAILTALLPALAIGAALVGAFVAVRAAVQAVEDRFGSLSSVFSKAVGAIFGLIDGLVESFSLLDDAIADIALSAANKLISGFETGINGVISLLNAIPGVDITPADIGRIENSFEGSAARVRGILARNISEGVQEGFRSTDTFQALDRVFEQVKGLLSGGILPEDFDEAKLKALLDQISGTRDGMAALNNESKKAATSIRTLRASVDPAEAAFKKLNDALEAFSKINKDNFAQTEFARETLRLLAEDLADVTDAQFRYGRQLELVTRLEEEGLLTTQRASLARKQFALEARQDIDATLASVFPLIRAEGELLKVETDLLRLRTNGQITEDQAVEARRRLARESFGLSKTEGQLNEEIQALTANQELLGLSTAELEHEVRQLNIAFLETQRTAAAGANRAILKLVDDSTNAAAFMEKTFQDTFKGIEDAVVSFTQTGTFSVNEFFRNFAEQLIRLGTQQALAGFGGFFTNTFGGQGGFGAAGPSSQGIAGIGGLFTQGLGSLFGFQNGGAFTVGANTAAASLPGIDNRLIAFRARDNEEVSITPRGGQMTQSPVNQVFNIQTRDADSFKRSQTQIQNRALAGINQARRRR